MAGYSVAKGATARAKPFAACCLPDVLAPHSKRFCLEINSDRSRVRLTCTHSDRRFAAHLTQFPNFPTDVPVRPRTRRLFL